MTLFEVTNTTWEICKLQSTNQYNVRSEWHWFVRCDLQIFSGCICHLEQRHAQSPFLFPILFSINYNYQKLLGRVGSDTRPLLPVTNCNPGRFYLIILNRYDYTRRAWQKPRVQVQTAEVEILPCKWTLKTEKKLVWARPASETDIPEPEICFISALKLIFWRDDRSSLFFELSGTEFSSDRLQNVSRPVSIDFRSAFWFLRVIIFWWTQIWPTASLPHVSLREGFFWAHLNVRVFCGGCRKT